MRGFISELWGMVKRPRFECSDPNHYLNSARVRSVDHLVRPQQQRGRDREAERLGGLHVDDEIKFRGLLDGQVSGLGALEDLVNVGRGTPKQLSAARSIRHETADNDKFAEGEYRRQAVLDRQIRKAS